MPQRSLPIKTERPMPALSTASAVTPRPVCAGVGATKSPPAAIPARVLYPVGEACALLGGIGPATAYRWSKSGRLRLTRLGGRTFVAAAEIERLVAGEVA